MKKLAIPACLILFLFVLPASATQPLVKELSFQATEDALTLVFGLTEPVQPKIFNLQHPNRIVVDLPQARLEGTLPTVPSDAYFIQNIRRGSPDGQNLRIVLDLDRPTKAPDFWLTSDVRTGQRLVVNLKAEGHAPARHHPTLAKLEPLVTPTKVIPRISPIDNNLPKLPSAGESRVVFTRDELRALPQVQPNLQETSVYTKPRISPVSSTAWSQPRYRGSRDLIVAIDPGHGGKDTGARGPSGTCEKDVVLAISRRLADRINAVPGMRAVLTRSTDIFIPLHQRVVKARNAHADLFVAIHADASPFNSSAQGASVFALSEHGASSEAAKLIAAKENAADLVGGVAINDKDDLLASVLVDMSLSATMEASREAAEDVLGHMYQVGEIHKEKVQYAGFAVLKAPDVPGMLVETAYISNPEEEAKLRHPVHQEQIAEAIFDGIREYFLSRPPEGTRMAQVVQQQRSTASSERRTTSDY